MREWLKDWWYNNGDFVQAIVFMLSVGAIILIIAYSLGSLFEQSVCDKAIAGIGMAHRWSILGGCQIEVDEGVWIPLRNWRYVAP